MTCLSYTGLWGNSMLVTLCGKVAMSGTEKWKMHLGKPNRKNINGIFFILQACYLSFTVSKDLIFLMH